MTTIYIIHPSAIIQAGLGDIVRRRLQCPVTCFSSIAELQDDEIPVILIDERESFDSRWSGNNIPKYLFRISLNGTTDSQVISMLEDEEAIVSKLQSAILDKDAGESEKEGLSAREIDVLRLVALGHSNKEIADKLFISTHTVMSHRKNITEKLGIKSISGLTVYAILNDFIDTTNLNVSDLI